MKQGVSAGWKLNRHTFLRICFLYRLFLNFEAEFDFTGTCKLNIHTFLRICFLYRLFLNFEAELDFTGTCIFEIRTNRHLPQSVPIKLHVQNRRFGHSWIWPTKSQGPWPTKTLIRPCSEPGSKVLVGNKLQNIDFQQTKIQSSGKRKAHPWWFHQDSINVPHNPGRKSGWEIRRKMLIFSIWKYKRLWKRKVHPVNINSLWEVK